MSSLEKYIIVAMTRRLVIGKDNKLPWHLPEDLQLFKKLTTGNTVIMGRNTYRSIGRPLPNRHNIIVTGSDQSIPGATICRTVEEALCKAEEMGEKIFFIGGAKLYAAALNIVDYMYISWINDDCQGDVYFPQIDFSKWKVVSEENHRDFNNTLYRRIK